MVKSFVVCAALVTALAIPSASHAETYFGFQIGITNAPPPPYLAFHDDPDLFYLPAQHVYVVRHPAYDVFRYGGYYYACRDGFWYRGRSFRGPFMVIDVRYVPRSIFNVPDRHWKHRHNDGSWYRHRWNDDRRGWATLRSHDRRTAQRDRGWNRGDVRDRGRDRDWNRRDLRDRDSDRDRSGYRDRDRDDRGKGRGNSKQRGRGRG